MRLVITDGYTLNPGDLSWKPFEQFGEVVYYDRTAAIQVVERCLSADIIITNKTPIDAKILEAGNSLRLISVTATGYNVVDIATAKKEGVVVCNVPEYGTHSVAQHAFALILELTNKVGIHAQSVRNGDWTRSPDWCYSKTPIIELKDKTLGIIGLGKIGAETARIAHAYGMNVIYHGGRSTVSDVNRVSLPQLFSQSDFISIHCPLKQDNVGFIDRSVLSHMKPTAFLINTSRGQLIDENDLAAALRNNTLAGAALDVLSKEPPPQDHPLLGLSNCLITPHNAWVSFEARKRIMETTFENVRAALSGKPQNVVS